MMNFTKNHKLFYVACKVIVVKIYAENENDARTAFRAKYKINPDIIF